MKIKTGIFIALLATIGLSSCGKRESSKMMINEVLIENENNFQDDYGMHSAWIEIFNKSFGSYDLAGCYIKTSSTPGDTAVYTIPKGDVLTLIKPRQHALFWADGQASRGTFHVNFTLDAEKANWIGLYDSGNLLLDQMVVPANVLQPDQSYARIDDGLTQTENKGKSPWEVKGASSSKYVTPSTNNTTKEKNEKVENFKAHDESGIGMSITAMTVVFCGLLLLFVAFKIVGNAAIKLSKRNAMKAHGITDKKVAKEIDFGQRPGEVFAAIAMALHEAQEDVHDVENTILTINKVKRSYSPWSSKIYTLRETPNRK